MNSLRKPWRSAGIAMVAAALAPWLPTPCPAQQANDIATQEAQWGSEALAQIDHDFWLPSRHLYADKSSGASAEPDAKRQPAFMWGCGVQLSALAQAALGDHDRYAPRLTSYADALQIYWQTDALGGFDVLPCPKPHDRYYDDNAWMVLALIKTFEATREPRYLHRAEATMAFVLSGEDNKLGGGLYWRESDRASKNTCSNAPAIVGCLRLYQLTGKSSYLDTAHRLYDWTQSHLQDTDGLYWDNISVDGKIGRAKFSYNSALMIRAACLFYQVTGDSTYLAEARRIGAAAQRKWVGPDASVDDAGRFGHLLLGAFLALYSETGDKAWLAIVDHVDLYIHSTLRDPGGHYTAKWKNPSPPHGKLELLDQASVAQAFLEASQVAR